MKMTNWKLVPLACLALLAGTVNEAAACRVAGAVCLHMVFCMGPQGREYAGPLRAAANSGDPNGISADTAACQGKYGQQHGKDYGQQSKGCTANEFRALAKKALTGSCR